MCSAAVSSTSTPDMFPFHVTSHADFRSLGSIHDYNAEDFVHLAFVVRREAGKVGFESVDLNARQIPSVERQMRNSGICDELTGKVNVDWTRVQRRLSNGSRVGGNGKLVKASYRNCRVNVDNRLAFRWQNVFLVKSMFTFGMRRVPRDEKHVIQTYAVPLLLNVPKKEASDLIKRKYESGRFFDKDVEMFKTCVLEPYSTYELKNDELKSGELIYVLLTVQKTLFSLHRVRLDFDLTTHRQYQANLRSLNECEVLEPVSSEQYRQKKRKERLQRKQKRAQKNPSDKVERRGRKSKELPAVSEESRQELSKRKRDWNHYKIPKKRQSVQQPQQQEEEEQQQRPLSIPIVPTFHEDVQSPTTPVASPIDDAVATHPELPTAFPTVPSTPPTTDPPSFPTLLQPYVGMSTETNQYYYVVPVPNRRAVSPSELETPPESTIFHQSGGDDSTPQRHPESIEEDRPSGGVELAAQSESTIFDQSDGSDSIAQCYPEPIQEVRLSSDIEFTAPSESTILNQSDGDDSTAQCSVEQNSRESACTPSEFDYVLRELKELYEMSKI